MKVLDSGQTQKYNAIDELSDEERILIEKARKTKVQPECTEQKRCYLGKDCGHDGVYLVETCFNAECTNMIHKQPWCKCVGIGTCEKGYYCTSCTPKQSDHETKATENKETRMEDVVLEMDKQDGTKMNQITQQLVDYYGPNQLYDQSQE